MTDPAEIEEEPAQLPDEDMLEQEERPGTEKNRLDSPGRLPHTTKSGGLWLPAVLPPHPTCISRLPKESHAFEELVAAAVAQNSPIHLALDHQPPVSGAPTTQPGSPLPFRHDNARLASPSFNPVNRALLHSSSTPVSPSKASFSAKPVFALASRSASQPVTAKLPRNSAKNSRAKVGHSLGLVTQDPPERSKRPPPRPPWTDEEIGIIREDINAADDWRRFVRENLSNSDSNLLLEQGENPTLEPSSDIKLEVKPFSEEESSMEDVVRLIAVTEVEEATLRFSRHLASLYAHQYINQRIEKKFLLYPPSKRNASSRSYLHKQELKAVWVMLGLKKGVKSNKNTKNTVRRRFTEGWHYATLLNLCGAAILIVRTKHLKIGSSVGRLTDAAFMELLQLLEASRPLVDFLQVTAALMPRLSMVNNVSNLSSLSSNLLGGHEVYSGPPTPINSQES
ncbi:MAG: hypothetical protein M1829_001475 [Trizodia sp. TS-e1964]|nr:MAG: hypothetical protein M1829_001475 [Trizodia sp. TS-e1964]